MLWLTLLQQPNLCITLSGLSCIMLRHLAKKLTDGWVPSLQSAKSCKVFDEIFLSRAVGNPRTSLMTTVWAPLSSVSFMAAD